MGIRTCYESYPPRIVILSNLLGVLSYAFGTVILWLFSPPVAAAYVGLVVFSYVLSMYLRCRFCCYHGRRCFSGMGTLAARLMAKGNAEEFGRSRNVAPAAIASFAAMLLPLAGAVALGVSGFSWLSLAIVIIYLMVAIFPGFYLRPRIYCSSCKQGQMGCPAYRGMRGGAAA